MKFSQKRFYAYDQTLFGGMEMGQIFAAADDVTRDRPALSGAEDVIEAMLIWSEWYETKCPIIDFREVKRASTGAKIDDLYNEPAAGKTEYNRTVQVHGNPQFAKPDAKYDGKGQQSNQPLTVHFPAFGLFKADYYPEVGDEIPYSGRIYHITEVFSDEQSYFGHTGIPLHVTCKAEIRHLDGSMSRAPQRVRNSRPPTSPNSLLQRMSSRPA